MTSPFRKALAESLLDLDEARAEQWEAALRAAHGNSAKASRDLLGANRQRGNFLTKRHGLQELAKELKAKRRACATE